MKNENKRKIIAAGAYRVVSKVPLKQDGAVILVDDLLRRVSDARRTLKKILPKKYHGETVAVVEGLRHAEIRTVQLSTDNLGQKESILVNVVGGQDDVGLAMVVLSNQGDLLHEGTVDETIIKALEEKTRTISEEIKESVNHGNKLAEALAKKPLSSEDLEGMVKDNLYPDTTRKVASLAEGKKLDIDLATGKVTVGGGLPITRQVPLEKNFLLERCVIWDVSASGRVVVRMKSEHPVLSEYGLQKNSEIVLSVTEHSLDSQILDFARAARVPIDLLVMVTDKVSNHKLDAKVLEIIGHDQVLEHVIMKLTELKGEL